MFPGIDYIKTIVNGISSTVTSLLKEMNTKLSKEIDKKIEVSKADWNQNNETHPDYVKNRPFYTEMLGTSIEGMEIDNIPTDGTLDQNIPLEIGQVWNVGCKMVNGSIESSYYTNLEVQQAEDGTLYLGDPDVNHYPFYITTTSVKSNSTWVSNAGVSSIILTCVSGTTHEEVVHQIPAKYIKDMYYTGDPVETVLVEETTVSFSKNGQVYIGRLSPYTGLFPDEGKIYNVNWDGGIYQCTCYLDGSIPTLGVLGNPDPFSIAFIADSNSLSIATKTANSHTISISGFIDKIVKIDPKYIPTDALDNVLCVNLFMGEGDTITADKTFAEITEAVGSEMCVIARFSSGETLYLSHYDDTTAEFSNNEGVITIYARCNSSDTWESGAYTPTASDVGAIPSPATAVVGQTIVVKAVDVNGVPTEWEAADLPTGGGGIYGLLEQYDMFELAYGVLDSANLPTRVVITEDSGGNAFDVDGIIVWTDIKATVSYTDIAFNNRATAANPTSHPYHYGLSHGIRSAFNLYLCGANNTFLQLLADGTLKLYKKQNKGVDGIDFYPAENIVDVPSSITAICLCSRYNISSGTFYKVWGLKKKNV